MNPEMIPDVLNPFDYQPMVVPQPGWMHIRILERADTGPSLGLVNSSGAPVNNRIILPEGETRDGMRVVATVLTTSDPLGEKDQRIEAGSTIMFAPLVRAVPIPWAPVGTEMLIRYECAVAVLTKETDG